MQQTRTARLDPLVATHPPGSITEIEAESVAYLVAATHGLDTTAYTFPYILTWAADSNRDHPEDVVRATGHRVLTAARWILDRTQPDQADPARTPVPTALAQRVAISTLAADGVRVRSSTQRAATTSPPVPRPTLGPTRESRSTRAPATRASDSAPGRSIDRDELLAVHGLALNFYLDHCERSWVPGYLHSRGLEAALDAPWLAGHAPRGWTGLVDHLRGSATGIDDATLLASGLAVRARTGNLIDRFRDRLILPIHNADGAIVAFVGRAHPDADPDRVPKYLNSPTTTLYSKGDHLYGLGAARTDLTRGARPVLVEGTLDAIAVTTGTGGRCIGLAFCGTALTPTQVRLLARAVDLPTRGITVAFDPDPAGDTARRTALQLLAVHGAVPTAAALPPGIDPAALLAHHGPAALTAVLLDTTPLADQVIDHVLGKWSDQFDSPVARINAVRYAAPFLASLDPASALRQADRVATWADLPVHVIHGEITTAITSAPLMQASDLRGSPHPEDRTNQAARTMGQACARR